MRPSHSNSRCAGAYTLDATVSRALSRTQLSLVATAFVSAGALAAPSAWTLSFDGYGPMHIGMTVRDAEKALHFKLTAEPLQPGATPDDRCEYFENEQKLPGLSFMTGKGRILRIDVGDRRYRTERGARVGMTEAQIKKLYPAIRTEPHHYVDEGHYLVLDGPDHLHSLLFETDGKIVIGFRAGEREPVSWIEGCQ
jgi:hypothetical protein